MREVGKVESIDKHGFATVVFDRKQACEHCQMCLQGKNAMKVSIRVKNSLNAVVGDSVSVEMSERIVLKSALVVYLIPVVLVTIALLSTMRLDEKYQIISFVASLALAVVIDVIIDKSLKKRKKAIAKMTEIIDNRLSTSITHEQNTFDNNDNE